ncbi:MAG: SDR family oxidoreductase [Bacilli bacterium]|nr:SDR family oxidoreductase [Bacilli bacterium]
MNFKNKVALITGASRGIGASIAYDLASHGCNICINYKDNYQKAKELKSKVERDFSVKVLLVQADITKEEDIMRMVNLVINEFQKIDILINNAGIAIDSVVDNKNIANFHKILDTNLIGPFLLSREVAKYMVKQKNGTIINISSTNGMEAYYSYSLDYDASKAGLISLTHNLAEIYAPYIRVNAVAPGWVNTEMNLELDDSFVEEEIKGIYLRRFAEPVEIAKVVTFLASDDAKYINNEVIRVDGGTRHV